MSLFKIGKKTARGDEPGRAKKKGAPEGSSVHQSQRKRRSTKNLRE